MVLAKLQSLHENVSKGLIDRRAVALQIAQVYQMMRAPAIAQRCLPVKAGQVEASLQPLGVRVPNHGLQVPLVRLVGKDINKRVAHIMSKGTTITNPKSKEHPGKKPSR